MSFYEWREAPPADYAVLGDPVGHSLSPAMHNALYKALGLNLNYSAIRVPLEEFDQALDRLVELGYQGVNCTVPLKEAAFDWCQEIDGTALSVNTVDLTSSTGTNTDIPAFLLTLARFTTGKRLLVLGAGGTARALLPALVMADYEVVAWNRTASKLEQLLEETALSEIVDQVEKAEAQGFDVVVNTTSASLAGDVPPVDWSGGIAAYDLAYKKDGLTPFLQEANNRGLQTLDGLPMLVEQGALSFEWWTGKTALRSVMTEAIQCL